MPPLEFPRRDLSSVFKVRTHASAEAPTFRVACVRFAKHLCRETRSAAPRDAGEASQRRASISPWMTANPAEAAQGFSSIADLAAGEWPLMVLVIGTKPATARGHWVRRRSGTPIAGSQSTAGEVAAHPSTHRPS